MTIRNYFLVRCDNGIMIILKVFFLIEIHPEVFTYKVI